MRRRAAEPGRGPHARVRAVRAVWKSRSCEPTRSQRQHRVDGVCPKFDFPYSCYVFFVAGELPEWMNPARVVAWVSGAPLRRAVRTAPNNRAQRAASDEIMRRFHALYNDASLGYPAEV